MKANATVYIVIGILLVLAIYSLYQLNQVKGVFTKASSRLLEGENPAPSVPPLKPAENVSASQLTKALQDNMNNVKEVTVEFFEKPTA